MSIRVMAAVLLLGAFLLASCAKKENSVPMSDQTHSAAGISWNVPQEWNVEGQRMMRVATYTIGAAGENGESAECAVFYFGTDQGGDVRMNIDRWSGQFEGAPAAEESNEEINGIQVTKVKIEGTYLAPGGMTMESTGKKEGYLLVGAIVAAPQGSVFYKMTGPANTVQNAEEAFNAMLATLKTE